MFHLKRTLSVSLVVLILSIAALMIPATYPSTVHAAAATQHLSPSATQVSCTYDNCDGKSPVSTGCANDGVVVHTKSWSTVELVFSPTCHAAWAHIQFNSAMPSGYSGDATIHRGITGKSCFDTGGNGDVLPGQHSCYSPMLGDGPTESTFAGASYTNDAANTGYALGATSSY
jgi:hypothetical protein